MAKAPLEPLDVPWSLRPLDSAETAVRRAADGRLRFTIRHAVLEGVTPPMLVWWFGHMEGDVEVGGRSIPRYRAWHPRDHVRLTYVRPAADGARMGPGARIRIEEFFGARPEYRIDVVSTVLWLHERGFAHADRVGGLELARMEYTFTPVEGGTLYENWLEVGTQSRLWRLPVNRLLRPRLFPEAMGHAWLRHNVEEVGNLPHFLPELYEQETGTEAPRRG